MANRKGDRTGPCLTSNVTRNMSDQALGHLTREQHSNVQNSSISNSNSSFNELLLLEILEFWTFECCSWASCVKWHNATSLGISGIICISFRKNAWRFTSSKVFDKSITRRLTALPRLIISSTILRTVLIAILQLRPFWSQIDYPMLR